MAVVALVLRQKHWEVGLMTWGITRIMLFSGAFLLGTWITRTMDPRWNTQAVVTAATELSTSSGSDLVVSCVNGSPIVEQVAGVSRALRVKCATSQMLVHSRRQNSPAKPAKSWRHSPAGPVAVVVLQTRTANNAE
jgi:hypothetical protein